MSTVPEVVVARHADMNCFAISVITDLGVPGKIQVVTHEDVQNEILVNIVAENLKHQNDVLFIKGRGASCSKS